MYCFPVVNIKNLICDAVCLEVLLKYHEISQIFTWSEEPTHVFVAPTSCSILFWAQLLLILNFLCIKVLIWMQLLVTDYAPEFRSVITFPVNSEEIGLVCVLTGKILLGAASLCRRWGTWDHWGWGPDTWLSILIRLLEPWSMWRDLHFLMMYFYFLSECVHLLFSKWSLLSVSHLSLALKTIVYNRCN